MILHTEDMGRGAPAAAATSTPPTGCAGRRATCTTWPASPASPASGSCPPGRNSPWWRRRCCAGCTTTACWTTSSGPRRRVRAKVPPQRAEAESGLSASSKMQCLCNLKKFIFILGLWRWDILFGYLMLVNAVGRPIGYVNLRWISTTLNSQNSIPSRTSL